MAGPQFQRAKRERNPEPITFDVEGDEFALHPKLSTRALEAIGRASKEDISAMFDFLRFQFVGDSYDRFLDLDLDLEDELPGFIEFVVGLYGEPGKSDGSPTSSRTGGTSSKQTVSASTG